MNPRRENGAILVNPMTSEVMTSGVRTGSADMRALLQGEARIEPRTAAEKQVTSRRAVQIAPGSIVTLRLQLDSKEQGRRRSMAPTTLPAPDIEIGPAPS
uniref:hypothetical protein n=1 Tax=Bradyrhizobium sp. (strain ORS 278) TaxID=114615 RepID=UPI00138A41D4|nr:hypothetical protein [Bradyrhizobium sp. ORS 278]